MVKMWREPHEWWIPLLIPCELQCALTNYARRIRWHGKISIGNTAREMIVNICLDCWLFFTNFDGYWNNFNTYKFFLINASFKIRCDLFYANVRPKLVFFCFYLKFVKFRLFLFNYCNNLIFHFPVLICLRTKKLKMNMVMPKS